MFQQRMIENEKDLFCQRNHQLPVQMVNLDPKLKLNQRLLCSLCIDYIEPYSSIIGFKKAVQIIEDNRKNVQEYLSNIINVDIKYIESLQNEIITLKSQLVQVFDQLIGNSQYWIENLQSTISQYSEYSFFKELDSIIPNQYQQSIQNDKMNLTNQIKILNDAWSNKINFYLASFQSYPQYQTCKSILNRINDSQKIILQQQQLSPYKLQFINDSIEQKEKCRAIAFDSTGKIMVSTSDSDNEIKIWNFDHGQLMLINSLKGHQGNVYCLTYSKIKNYFFSGSCDNSIRLWKQLNNNNNWQSSKPNYEHNNPIHCMILTEKEDQLISGSSDQTIKIWQVDFSNNQLQFLYSLEKHTNVVVSLSLNESESVLVSDGYDGTIIIWQKGANQQWEFQQTIINSIQEQGKHVKFLTENQFILVAYKSNNVCVFECIDGVYQENIDKRVQFKKDNKEQANWAFFPVIYIKDKNLICIRHIFHICILKVENEGKLQVVEEMDCQNQGSYGAITNNGQYLIFWGGRNNKYETYEIQYK